MFTHCNNITATVSQLVYVPLRPQQFQVVRFKVAEGSNWAGGDQFGVSAPSLVAAELGVVIVRLDFHKLMVTTCGLVEVSAEWR